MSSFKICCWSIIILGLAFTSCSEEKSENKEYKEYHPAEDNIINPYWAEFTEDAPTRSPDCWNKNVLGKLKIKTIELYAFGGENPDDTLEKKLFSFSNRILACTRSLAPSLMVFSDNTTAFFTWWLFERR